MSNNQGLFGSSFSFEASSWSWVVKCCSISSSQTKEQLFSFITYSFWERASSYQEKDYNCHWFPKSSWNVDKIPNPCKNNNYMKKRRAPRKLFTQRPTVATYSPFVPSFEDDIHLPLSQALWKYIMVELGLSLNVLSFKPA